LEHPRSKSSEARLRAEDKFAKANRRDAEVMDFQRRIREDEEAKLLRLRSLRLAKEAADRESLAKSEAKPSAGKGTSRRARQAMSGTSGQ